MAYQGLLADLVRQEAERLAGVVPQDVGKRKGLLLEIVRAIDSSFHSARNGDAERFQWHSVGWNKALSFMMGDFCLEPGWAASKHIPEVFAWSNQFVTNCGRLAHAERILLMERAGVVEIADRPGDNRILVKYAYEHIEVERFDASAAREYYENRFNSYHQTVIDELKKQLPRIHERMAKLVRPWGYDLIQYQYDDVALDKFFEKWAYHYSIAQQGYDDFHEDSMFGGIRYALYCKLARLYLGVHIKHIEFCNLYIARHADAKPSHLYSLVCDTDRMIYEASEYTGLPPNAVSQMIATLLLHGSNYAHHTDQHSSPAPFIQIGANSVVRSSLGMTSMFEFMNANLKALFPEDYFNAVNEREAMLIRELSILLKSGHVSVGSNVMVRGPMGMTDIDFFAYDSRTHVLGLFQLKWQDRFGYSLKSRNSRLSNFLPKTNEWIDKVQKWFEDSEWSIIARALGVRMDSQRPEMKMFVINRNNIHFTGASLDARAAWCTWHQLLEARTKLGDRPENFILELFTDLQRRHTEYYEPQHSEGYSFRLREHEIVVGSAQLE